MANPDFWKGKRVFITGHTGFKGSWLSLWLHRLGAVTCGYSLPPPTNPSLFELAQIGAKTDTIIGDIRNLEALTGALEGFQPEILFHLAAQPLVRESYVSPVETYEINVIGTVNLLQAARSCNSLRSVVVITSDKCYANQEWIWGYRESDPMGGYDPYSSSKGCAELVVDAYRQSFFNGDSYADHGVGIASARAGNVIGGGDWAEDRLVPDCIRALLQKRPITVRNPGAIRPWQHVLEPLHGYLLLAEKLFENGPDFNGGWNFGPADKDCRPVLDIVQNLCRCWGETAEYVAQRDGGPHEANFLKLDSSKALSLLGWQPKWNLETALQKVVEWSKAFRSDADLNAFSISQIQLYEDADIKSRGTEQ